MEILAVLTILCFAPFAILVFGYWLGRGAPGWPWALVRREPEQPGGAYSNGRKVYYEQEEYQR
jgi:hypothetical protein